MRNYVSFGRISNKGFLSLSLVIVLFLSGFSLIGCSNSTLHSTSHLTPVSETGISVEIIKLPLPNNTAMRNHNIGGGREFIYTKWGEETSCSDIFLYNIETGESTQLTFSNALESSRSLMTENCVFYMRREAIEDGHTTIMMHDRNTGGDKDGFFL